MNKEGLTTIVPLSCNPVYNYLLRPFGDSDTENLEINLTTRPNLWIRFWMWVFFGWRFRKI